MTDDLETQLRQALHDRADAVRTEHLTRTLNLSADEREPGQVAYRSRRGPSWLLAAAAAVVVAAGATGIVVATRPGPATPEPSTTVTVTATPTTGAPQQRNGIPWAEVGPGWSAAAWAASRDATTATLYLLSPSGARYPVGTMPRTAVYDITRDGRRILTGSTDPDAVLEWDVATGTSRSIPLGEPGGATYTKPDGQALLTVDDAGPTPRLQRRTLAGAVTLTYPDGTGLAQQTPDGHLVVGGSATGLAVYGNATGTLVRTLAPPPGYGDCAVVSWWPDGRAVTRCVQAGSGPSNLWLYPLDGGPPTALTSATSGSATPFGYQAAWPVRNGTLVQEAVGCGVGPLARLTSASTSTRLPLSSPADPVAVVGDVVYLDVAATECGGNADHSFVAYDAVTGRSTTLLGGSVDGGTAGPMAVIDPNR
ncbi:MAG TPA: hypothetical protein VFT68_14385 [Lapillicoccus sp.]|nr:hypothetical protein [Lapillicoccus sp.]